MKTAATIQQLIAAGVALVDAGLVRGKGGNLSFRLPDNEVWITASGANLGQLTILDFVSAMSNEKRPSSELPMHQAIYSAHPHVTIILHAHPPQAIALGITGRALPALTPDAYLHLGALVPLVPYLTPTTNSLGDAVSQAVNSSPAVLLQNHGVIVTGGTVSQALLRLFLLEEHAAILMQALAAGGEIRTLSTADQQDLDTLTGGRYRLK